MAAVNMSLVARSEYAVHQLMKRKNWAQREPGVIVVLVIVFLVFLLVIAMFINKRVRLHLPPISHPSANPKTNKTNH
jgi:biopolymer transport protein ExbD